MIRHSWIRRGLIIAVALITRLPLGAQNLTLERAIALSDSLNGTIRAAALGAEAYSVAEKGALDLAPPQLQFQAPTGNFYTAGVQQNFEYPGVYGARKTVARARTSVAESEWKLTRAENRYQTTKAYLNLLLALERKTLGTKRALIFSQLSEVAGRRFHAGDIGQVERSFAEMKAAEAMRKLKITENELLVAEEELYLLTGIRGVDLLDSLVVGLVMPSSSVGIVESPWVQLAGDKNHLAREELKLSRRQQLPGFYAAFMNQGERDSPVENRFGFGISIPIWFWQVNANVKAARLKEQQSQLELEWTTRTLTSEWQSTALKLNASLAHIEQMQAVDLPLLSSISSDAGRTFEAGEISIMEYLRILSETQAIQEEFLSALFEHEQLQNQINFITSIP